jgi:nucleoid DNA-binding protein
MSKYENRRIAKQLPFDYLITEVAHRTGITKYKADEIIRVTFAAIKDLLFNRCIIDIPRFGSFYLILAKSGLFHLPNGEKIWKGNRLQGRFKFTLKFKKELEGIKVEDIKENDVEDITLQD